MAEKIRTKKIIRSTVLAKDLRMGKRGIWLQYLMLSLFAIDCKKLSLCANLGAEGKALLTFRKGVEVDPYDALANWGKPGVDHCFWFGVDCSVDGRVVSLELKDLCLVGRITSEIGKLVHLKSLILYNNSFSGTIPEEISELSKLEVLDLGHNNLSEPFPRELVRLVSLKLLVLEENRFINSSTSKAHENKIPNFAVEDMQLSKRTSIKRNVESATTRRLLKRSSVHRSKQHPHESNHIKNVTSAPSLNLTPQYPSPSSPLKPSALRYLSPPISPTSASPSTDLLSSEASPKTSSSRSDLSQSQPSHELKQNVDSASPKAAGKHKKTHWVVYVSIGAGVGLLVALSTMYFLCCRANKVVSVMPWKTGLSGQLQKALVTGLPSLRRSEIEIACEGFSNIIGSLPGCSLYKGTLSSGVEIAVTSCKINSAKECSDQHEAMFRKKISTLSKVNHKNFVNLLGYCEEQEPFSRMMVYEYAPNGTLFEHLHVKEAEPLNWRARLRVAMGIAYCLDHMHRLDPPFILRNLNSSTVYLTEDHAAKISDLPFWNEGKESTLSSDNAEEFETPFSSQQEVVYKFGIMLLELVSGRLPFSKDDGLLVLWASSYLTGKRELNGIVDQTLESVCEEDVIGLCDVIRACVDTQPKERPTMADIVAQLRQITGIAPDAAMPKLSPLWWAELEIISCEAS
ncbi:hypothetical protein HPP92_007566 [Vanilla planifolia]|uniref:Protein kinase domain-containing protein n=1 Tax=Vanilla planifolia TaxID=51239 RepID=A0A835V9J5_VANPL|nr:hypothetical protein HPP92_007566 [Vanilla planifolia]